MSDMPGSLLKDKADCECGDERCTLYGTLGKEDRQGRRHVRGCPCPSCRGRRNNKQGKAKQRKAARQLGIGDGRFVPANEENWAGLFANEVKSGKQVGPITNWFTRVEHQVVANQPDHGALRRPTRAVAMPDGWGDDGIVAVRLSAWREHIAPALNAFCGEC